MAKLPMKHHRTAYRVNQENICWVQSVFPATLVNTPWVDPLTALRVKLENGQNKIGPTVQLNTTFHLVAFSVAKENIVKVLVQQAKRLAMSVALGGTPMLLGQTLRQHAMPVRLVRSTRKKVGRVM